MNDQVALETEGGGASPTLDAMRTEFARSLAFIKAVSPHGFTKSKTGNQVPRVRFESVAVGSALALRADPSVTDRVEDMTPLLDSKQFSEATRSDAANVKSKLLNRITLTRNWLLEQ
jgi:hypothetical protein